jgi:hypothetical protein
MSAIGGPAAITSGLVLDLDAGNVKSYPGSGTTWFDKSGNASNGTLTNGPTFNTGSLGSIVFDGTNDYGTLPNSTIYKPQFPLTISCTFNVSNVSNYGIFIRTDNTNTNHWGVSVSVGSDYSLGVTYGNGTANAASGRRSYSTVSNVIVQNRWYNFTIVLPDNLTCNGYLNGSSISIPYLSGDITTLAYGSVGATIGYRSDATNYYYNGRLSQIQIYNRALSASEVYQNFNAKRARFGI